MLRIHTSLDACSRIIVGKGEGLGERERETRSQHTLGNDAMKERVTFIAVGAEVCIKDVALGRGEGEGARQ